MIPKATVQVCTHTNNEGVLPLLHWVWDVYCTSEFVFVGWLFCSLVSLSSLVFWFGLPRSRLAFGKVKDFFQVTEPSEVRVQSGVIGQA